MKCKNEILNGNNNALKHAIPNSQNTGSVRKLPLGSHSFNFEFQNLTTSQKCQKFCWHLGKSCSFIWHSQSYDEHKHNCKYSVDKLCVFSGLQYCIFVLRNMMSHNRNYSLMFTGIQGKQDQTLMQECILVTTHSCSEVFNIHEKGALLVYSQVS